MYNVSQRDGVRVVGQRQSQRNRDRKQSKSSNFLSVPLALSLCADYSASAADLWGSTQQNVKKENKKPRARWRSGKWNVKSQEERGMWSLKFCPNIQLFYRSTGENVHISSQAGKPETILYQLLKTQHTILASETRCLLKEKHQHPLMKHKKINNHIIISTMSRIWYEIISNRKVCLIMGAWGWQSV